MRLESEKRVLVDGHVHIYGCYDIETVLDAAWDNFRSAADRLGVAQDFQAVLIFTESAGDTVFVELAEAVGQQIGAWTISRTSEPVALRLQRDDEARLLILAGRQLVSAEKLELSAYLVTEPPADGAPLDALLKQVELAGGIPVLPWGVGKWLGNRGRHVEKRLMQCEVPLLVSDNGGRPWFWPMPRLLRAAEQHGIPVLAGTDPLPRTSEQRQVGRFGFMLKGALSQESPGQDLKHRLRSLARSPARYGRREGAVNFFRNQLHMQLRRVN